MRRAKSFQHLDPSRSPDLNGVELSPRAIALAEIDADAWSTLNSDTSRTFPKPKSGRIAVKVINHLGDEVMKVFRVD